MRDNSEQHAVTGPSMSPVAQAKTSVLRAVVFFAGYFGVLWLAAVPKNMVPAHLGPLVWGVASTLGVVALTRFFLKHDRRSWREIGLAPAPTSMVRFFVGVILGIATYGLTFLAVAALVCPIRLVPGETPAGAEVLLRVSTILSLACMEEIGFRAYPLRTLTWALGSWRAQGIVAVAFAISHAAYGWSWTSVLAGVLPSAVLFGVAAAVSGGVAMPIGLHAALNFAAWAVGTKETAGFWTLAVDEFSRARVESWAPVIGAAVTLITAALLARWYPRRHEAGLVHGTQHGPGMV